MNFDGVFGDVHIRFRYRTKLLFYPTNQSCPTGKLTSNRIIVSTCRNEFNRRRKYEKVNIYQRRVFLLQVRQLAHTN